MHPGGVKCPCSCPQPAAVPGLRLLPSPSMLSMSATWAMPTRRRTITAPMNPTQSAHSSEKKACWAASRAAAPCTQGSAAWAGVRGSVQLPQQQPSTHSTAAVRSRSCWCPQQVLRTSAVEPSNSAALQASPPAPCARHSAVKRCWKPAHSCCRHSSSQRRCCVRGSASALRVWQDSIRCD